MNSQNKMNLRYIDLCSSFRNGAVALIVGEDVDALG